MLRWPSCAPWHDLNACPPVSLLGALVCMLNHPPWPVATATYPTEDGLTASWTSLGGPTETIGRSHESSSLIDSELQRILVRRCANDKKAKHHFTSADYSCIQKLHPQCSTPRYNALFTCRRSCTLLLSYGADCSIAGTRPTDWERHTEPKRAQWKRKLKLHNTQKTNIFVSRFTLHRGYRTNQPR